MIYAMPELTEDLVARLEALDAQRRTLGERAGVATPWIGTLRRQVRALSAESSIEIEGYRVPENEIAGIVAGDAPAAPGDADRMALACYAHAMDHVVIMAGDARFRWSDRVVLDLHFDACSFQPDKRPGLWRDHPIGVTSVSGPGLAYEGPPPGTVPTLMGEVVRWLQRGDLGAHAVVRAAMAHLHLVSAHPFSDGNGRVARIVQSLVLAREGLLAPEFGSIEPYLAANTSAYYAVLEAVQGGRYQPERDAAPWVEFCVTAHLDQIVARAAQLDRAALRWNALETIVNERGWPDRLVIALEHSLFDGTERAAYVVEAGVSAPTASADLRRLADAGLVAQQGRTRNTRYVATDALRARIVELAGQDVLG